MTDSPSCDVLFAMAGDVHRNSRALRQLRALADAGLRIRLLSLPGDALRSDLPEGITHDVTDVAGSAGPAFFLALHRRFSTRMQSVNARLVHASDLYVLSACRSTAARLGAPLTYDARELYTHVAATEGRPHVRWIWDRVQARGIRRAAHVWTVSEHIADHLSERYAVARPTVQVNAPPLQRVDPDPWIRDTLRLPPDARIVLHLGQLRRDRGAETLIDAMADWPDDGPDAHLVFLGYGPERAALQTRAGRGPRVHFLDPVPPDRIQAVAADAQAGVTLLQPSCLNHRYALPNKLFDYLAAGLPVVASDLEETGALVRRLDCGIPVPPADAAAVRRALLKVCLPGADTERWRRNARAAGETFDWNAVSDQFTRQVIQLIA